MTEQPIRFELSNILVPDRTVVGGGLLGAGDDPVILLEFHDHRHYDDGCRRATLALHPDKASALITALTDLVDKVTAMTDVVAAAEQIIEQAKR